MKRNNLLFPLHYALALLSSGIMAAAGRFGSHSDIDIEAILADKDCKSTNNSTKVAFMCLNQYLFITDRSPDFSTYSKVELDKLLASFYVKQLLKTIEFRLFEVILSVTDICVLNFIKNNNRVEFL